MTATIAPNTITVNLDDEGLQLIRELHERLDRMQAQIDQMPEHIMRDMVDAMERSRRLHVTHITPSNDRHAPNGER